MTQKMILFDYGGTLLYEPNFCPSVGNAAMISPFCSSDDGRGRVSAELAWDVAVRKGRAGISKNEEILRVFTAYHQAFADGTVQDLFAEADRELSVERIQSCDHAGCAIP